MNSESLSIRRDIQIGGQDATLSIRSCPLVRHGCRQPWKTVVIRIGRRLSFPSRSLFNWVLIVFATTGAAQEAPPSGYNYPVKPGTQQWQGMSVAERRLACDVPLATCRQMNTSNLIQTCLDYPLLIDLHASSSGFSGGLALIETRFTPLRELRARGDAARELLARYKMLARTPLQQITAKRVYDHAIIPALLAEDDIINKLTSSEMIDLARTALRAMANQRAALGLCASEGAAARIVAKVVLTKKVPVIIAGTPISEEDLGGRAAKHLLTHSDFTPEPQVLNRLVSLGDAEQE